MRTPRNALVALLLAGASLAPALAGPPAWAARRDLRAGQPLEREAFERRELRPGDVRGPALADWPAAARLRRPLLAGHVLTGRDVEPIPAVARGARIRLVGRHGAVVLETMAHALQDGAPGQRVLVRPPASTQPLVARVVGEGVAEVEP